MENTIDHGYSDSSSSDEVDLETPLPKVIYLGFESSSDANKIKKVQDSVASTSWSSLKSQFVAMGFSSTLVDRAIEENGTDDADVLLDSLFTYNALEKSEFLGSPNGDAQVFYPHHEFDNSNSFQKDEDTHAETEDCPDKKDILLKMNFPMEQIELAIDKLGIDTPLPEMIDFIFAAQVTESSGSRDLQEFIDCEETTNEEITCDGLFETMDKTLYLLKMGFSEDEVSSAITNLGADTPIWRLADSIFVNRIATSNKECMQELGQGVVQPDFSRMRSVDYVHDGSAGKHAKRYADKAHRMMNEDSSSAFVSKRADDLKWKRKRKLEKAMPADGKQILLGSGSLKAVIHSEVLDHPKTKVHRAVHELESLPTYFLYGNAVEIPHDGWERISRFLHGIEPEIADSQHFSAYARKEGYVHNLPTGNRSRILPLPPLTIQEALPETKKYWPSWDNRTKLSCISSDIRVTQLCERLGKIVTDSQGMPSYEQRKDVLHHCTRLNLVWIGPCTLNCIRPEEIEFILGYPKSHTGLHCLSPAERLATLKYSFQTDTLGYHLSAIKEIFPDGLNVLSLYSGIGGAEVSLHRLGINLKCVVSVESSEENRAVLRNWWKRTGQDGELIEIKGVENLTNQRIISLSQQLGGFNIVIGRNPGIFSTARANISIDSVEEFDFPLFFEFVRVWTCVRNITCRT